MLFAPVCNAALLAAVVEVAAPGAVDLVLGGRLGVGGGVAVVVGGQYLVAVAAVGGEGAQEGGLCIGVGDEDNVALVEMFGCDTVTTFFG